MLPVSTKKVPAIAFNNVDLPEPLVPMTTTHEPSSMPTSTPFSERTSFKVPGLNVLEILRVSSTCGPRLPSCGFASGLTTPVVFFIRSRDPGSTNDNQQKYAVMSFQSLGFKPQ